MAGCTQATCTPVTSAVPAAWILPAVAQGKLPWLQLRGSMCSNWEAIGVHALAPPRGAWDTCHVVPRADVCISVGKPNTGPTRYQVTTYQVGHNPQFEKPCSSPLLPSPSHFCFPSHSLFFFQVGSLASLLPEETALVGLMDWPALEVSALSK